MGLAAGRPNGGLIDIQVEIVDGLDIKGDLSSEGIGGDT